MYACHEQAIVRDIVTMNSIVACCHGVKLCAHAAWDFRSQKGFIMVLIVSNDAHCTDFVNHFDFRHL